jgi:hypothetical protein
MDNVAWVVAFFVIAVGVSGAATWVGQRSGRAVPTAFGQLFAAIEERRTFMGLPVIVGVARSNRWVLIIVAFAMAPTAAAVVAAAAGAPSDLGTAIRPWSGDVARQAITTYLVLAAVFVVGCGWFLRVARAQAAAGSIETPALLRDRSPGDVAARLGVGAFVDEGGTLEELGWRGFLLPLVLLELDRGPATIAVALMWWAWHLPREVPGWSRLPSRRQWASNQAVFIGTCLGLSVLCTEAFLRTGGSFWPALLIHGGTNVWSKALGAGTYSRYRTDVRSVIVGVLAVVVVGSWVG